MNYGIPLETLPPLVREFASYKSAIQNASAKTVSEYLLDLRTFFRFLLARDQKISPDSEDFEKIDINGVDLDYIKNITTEDIYEFLLYTDRVRGNMASAKARIFQISDRQAHDAGGKSCGKHGSAEEKTGVAEISDA